MSHRVMDSRRDAQLDEYQTSQSGIRKGKAMASHDTVNPVPNQAVRMDTPAFELGSSYKETHQPTPEPSLASRGQGFKSP